MGKKRNKKKSDQELEIDLDNREFQQVRNLIEHTTQSIFLTGRAGTGKSTFLRYMMGTTKKQYVVLAPTGIAAVNVGGQTIHSFFRMPLKPLTPDDPDFASPRRMKERLKYPKRLISLLRELDLIVIDEISMVRADMIDFIDRVLRVYTKNQREPFGGKQLLLVGDLFQLEPVVTADLRMVLRRYYPQGTFFFNAHAFDHLRPVSIELRKVYRQQEGEFLEMLDRIRGGVSRESDLAYLNSRVMSASQPEKKDEKIKMTIATRRDMVDAINERHLAALKTPEVVYKGEIKGDFPQSSLPTDEELSLKVGAQIVFIKNDYDHRWVNGTLGRIDELSEDELRVTLDSGERVLVTRVVWSNIHYTYDEETKKIIEDVLGTFTQFPVKAAWALTVHKCQGLTFKNAIVDLGPGAFTSGQTYVAISRCTSLEGLQLTSPVTIRDIFVNPTIVKFAKTYNDSEAIVGSLERAEAIEKLCQAARALDEGHFAEATRLYGEASQKLSENYLSRESVRRLISWKTLRHQRRIDKIAEENVALHEQLRQQKIKILGLAKEYYLMGDECREAGMLSAAAGNYEKALSLDPEIPGLHRTLYDLYMEAGDKEAAKRHKGL